jgi:hypothetical protein
MKSPKELQREQDSVLEGFSEACRIPNAQDVRDWSAAYPEHADIIFEHAMKVNLVASVLPEHVTEPTQEEIDQAWQRHCDHVAKFMRRKRKAPILSH